MARSRVGGTSGLLSGRIGDVIYSITRNSDGSFRQQAAFNDGIRENPNTDAQARARLTMATIERAMFTYRDFMGTGFEGVDLGTNCVSKFSEINYNNIKYDVETYWDDPEWDETWWDLPKKGQTTARDGQFILSQGSLRKYGRWITEQCSPSWRQFGTYNEALTGSKKVRNLLSKLDLVPGEQVVVVWFVNGTTRSYNFVAYMMLWTDKGVDINADLTPSNWRRYLNVRSNLPIESWWDGDTGQLYMMFRNVDQYRIKSTGCLGRRHRILDNGKYRYNNCEMTWMRTGWPWEVENWQCIDQVYRSWKDE